ncbi:hypothetical protein V8C26DRAFT_200140 [Trichoderma gracile]
MNERDMARLRTMCQVMLGEVQVLQRMVCKRIRRLANGAIGAIDLWHEKSGTDSLIFGRARIGHFACLQQALQRARPMGPRHGSGRLWGWHNGSYLRDEYAVQHDGFCKGSWMVWPCWGILPSKGRGGAWTTATDRPVRASHLQTFKSPYGQARPAWQRKMDASRWRSAATAMRGRLQTLHRIALVYEGNGHGKIQVSMTGQRWLAGLDGRLSRDPAEDVPLAESVHVEGQTRGISRSFTRIGLLCLRRPVDQEALFAGSHLCPIPVWRAAFR